MRPNWPYFSCLDEGEGEGEVKHENEAISAAFFTQRMGEELNTRNATKMVTFFIFGWGEMREERKNAKAKHDKRGHCGRVFHAWNGRGYESGCECEIAHSRSCSGVVEDHGCCKERT